MVRHGLHHPQIVLFSFLAVLFFCLWWISLGFQNVIEHLGPRAMLSSWSSSTTFWGNAARGQRWKVIDRCHYRTSGSIIYTNLGDSFQFQHYIWRSINQSRFFNPCTPVYLISSAEAFAAKDVQEQLELLNVKPIDYASLSHPLLQEFRSAFFVQGDMKPDGNQKFNQYTSERMLAVYALMHSKNLSDVFHIENDNLIYFPINSVVSAMQVCEARLAVPFASARVAVVGVAFVAAADDLLPFIQFVIKVFEMGPQAAVAYVGSDWLNDMTLLGKFFLEQSSTLFVTELPSKLYHIRNYSLDATIENAFLSPVKFREGHPHSCIAEALPNTIFDSCVLGQYFGGTWAAPGLPYWQEDRQFDPRSQRLWWKNTYVNQRQVRIPYINETRILSLHVHSKRLEEFSSF